MTLSGVMAVISRYFAEFGISTSNYVEVITTTGVWEQCPK